MRRTSFERPVSRSTLLMPSPLPWSKSALALDGCMAKRRISPGARCPLRYCGPRPGPGCERPRDRTSRAQHAERPHGERDTVGEEKQRDQLQHTASRQRVMEPVAEAQPPCHHRQQNERQRDELRVEEKPGDDEEHEARPDA